MNTITIITTTYNRKKNLRKLYESLIKQTCYDFEWLIIDDGSTDNTSELVKKFYNLKFEIEYYYVNNGGKHRALNYAFEKLKTELCIIVDSDDFLVENAISEILKIHDEYKNRKEIIGYVFLKGYNKNKSVTKKFKDEKFIDNYNKYIINGNFKGDKAEVFKSKIFKKFKFNEYKDEKFLAEGYLWSEISKKYDMVFINKIIYICEYMLDGLTKSGRKLRIENPLGGICHAEEYINSIFNLNIIIKNILLYIAYSKFAKFNFIEIILRVKKYKIMVILLYPLGYFIYIIWKMKYVGG